ncbi:hypothetical protein POJ06DRAFT_239822 [Lipomyces tetrasporus]|uniref:Uncharacterized protein n=1 Tax=Lipomyces tetrasporus TaxID=54092 RepID=A0AAD7QPN2_9ASCO|nr:uncharacterized protein POJ06DRAFT_239822 [Lipomyces tetrasporus]KAJ8098971.1 hypothetical protein POJ06DRAFT_239822 [Lipomyces tetrasporus]
MVLKSFIGDRQYILFIGFRFTFDPTAAQCSQALWQRERYRRDAAFEYVSYYAAYEDFRIDLARMAEQRQICVARRAAWEEVKTNFPDHLVQTIVRWRKGEDLHTILETEYGK